ncbi:MAG: ADP-ribosylglycohydrolase family protein [Spirochaetaceae bacterium]
MRAWERERATMTAARPKLREEDDQTWNAIQGLEDSEDAQVRMLWYSEVPGSGAPERLMVAGVQALENRGMIVDGWESLVDRGIAALDAGDMPALHEVTTIMWQAFANARRDETAAYWQFQNIENWEQCKRALVVPSAASYTGSDEDFRSRLHAGWLGQIIGGALGTAIEGYTAHALKETLGDIRGYLVQPNTYNDDITYELAFLKAYERSGSRVTGTEIGNQWVALVPFGWSAELVALRNLRAGLVAPRSGSWNNPYSEWIGAQMRGAVCGMIAPGDPREAARLAWIDGEVSHTGNGILGEVFNAMLVALSFVEHDIRVALQQCVDALPAESEYASVVRFALDECTERTDWREAWGACEERYKTYNWVHAYPNACAEVVALWFGNGSFDETMHIVAMAGQDVDCNAAQIATALCVAQGPSCLSSDWTDPIGDELDTYVRGMKKLSIRELANWTARVAGRSGSR